MHANAYTKKMTLRPPGVFAVSRQGNVTITAALFIPVLVGMMAFNMELISYDRGQTRMHQAQMAGVLAAGKEGQPEDGASTNLQAIVNSYMAVNMGALGTREQRHFANIIAPLFATNGDHNYAVDVAANYDSWFSPVGDLILPPVRQVVKAERYYRKMETVFVLDASASVSFLHKGMMPLDSMRQGVNNYVDSALQNEGHRVSLLSFTKYTTLNLKYKDKLITSESRRWKDKYPFLQEVANDYGWGGSDDLLHENGPEGCRQGIAVDRPDIWAKFNGNTAAYVAWVETPPASKEDGFDVVMTIGKNSDPSESKSAKDVPVYYQVHGNCYSMGDGHSIPCVAGLQIPSSDRDRFPEENGFEWTRHFLDRSITVNSDAGPMPMLAHSNDRRELMHYLQLYQPGSGTASDEGIMWALRLLSPNWADIWEITDEDGEPVPAPYHGKVDKRIVLLTDGADVYGYFKNTKDNRNIFPDIGKHLKECGIDFYFVYFTLVKSGFVAKGNATYLVDTDDPEQWFVIREEGDAAVRKLYDYLTKLGKRQYRVRLAG